MPEWIPYETDDEPALEVSIDVDLDDDTEFRAKHAYLVTITVSGFAVDAGGQPDDTAAEGLFEIEQRAEAACQANGATPACTVSGGGRYRIFAYAAGDVEAPVSKALAGQALSVDVRCQRDDKWSTYEEYAIRGDDLENARDADLIAQMHEEGEDLSQAYDVIFEWSFATDALARAALEALEALENAGFDASRAAYDASLSVVKAMILSEETLEQARTAMKRALAPFDATYEGWETDIPDDEELD